MIGEAILNVFVYASIIFMEDFVLFLIKHGMLNLIIMVRRFILFILVQDFLNKYVCGQHN